MAPQSPAPGCGNPQCRQMQAPWLVRWRRPKGIWFNGKWYCGPECFEQAAASEFSRMNLRGEPSKPVHYRLPLGLLMVSRGFITRQDLQEALRAQRGRQKVRLGEWLLRQGFITEEQLTLALGIQWGCPVFHLAESPGFSRCALMVPLHAMETASMVPVHFLKAKRTLYVAFSNGIDFSTLRSLEQILDCRTQPCVIGASEMAAAHAAIRQMDRPSEILLDCPPDFHDLAREVRGWAESNRARQVAAAACPEYLWVRIEGAAVTGHLLFSFQDAPAPVERPLDLDERVRQQEPAYL